MPNEIIEYLIEYRNVKTKYYARSSFGFEDKGLAFRIAAKGALHPSIRARVVKQTREILKTF